MLMNLTDERVLVTGGAGFLGSHVCQRLKAEGVEPVYVPRKNDYDLTKEEEVIELHNHFNPSVIIHLAAITGGIFLNKNRPAELYYDNLIMGTLLMEHARRFDVKKFVTVGTVCSYPSDADLPFQESTLWEGYPEKTNAPYGLAKRMLMEQARAYRKQFGFRSVCLLPVNLYGPRENVDLETSHVIPALVRKFFEATNTEAKAVNVWGDGTATREFLYVKDAAEAVVEAAKSLNRTEPVNLGSGDELSIKELARSIKSLVGFNGRIEWDRSRPSGQSRRLVDTSRAEKHLGWSSSTKFSTGLRETIDWYSKNRVELLETPEETGFGRAVSVPDYVRTSVDPHQQ